MLFSSLVFLFIFLPFTLIVHTLLPKSKLNNTGKPLKKFNARNVFLLVMSLFFYAWGGVYYCLIMIGIIVLNYLGALWLAQKKQKFKLILIVVANLAVLFFFKYFNFFFDFISAITSREINVIDVLLPIGISFYIFQALSYVIDVYNGKAEAQRNIFSLALYISLFPVLIAGPIIKYNDLADQINHREVNSKNIFDGFRQFCWGLAKKVLISNALAEVVDKIFAQKISSLGMGVSWIGILFYTFQIYYDFSGYSDMAIGISKMFGFNIRKNFNYPYMSISIQDFWRRWHISLSSWFKEYVYFPLGGNRKGKLRTYLNLIIVFTLTGFWHGANYTFLIWGWWFGLFLVIERLVDDMRKSKAKDCLPAINASPHKAVWGWLYSMLVVIIGWVFFRSDNISQAFVYLGQMFSFGSGEKSVLYYLTIPSMIAFPFAIICSGYLQGRARNFYEKHKAKNWLFYTETFTTMLLLVLCIIVLTNGAYNPFIYFQF